MKVALDFPAAHRRRRAYVRDFLASEPPALPGLAPGTVRRWKGMPTWQPPETVVLARHRALDRPHWIVTNRRDPPAGYILEYDLGLVQRHEQPGTRRLTLARDAFAVGADVAPEDDAKVLGHLEQAPFPMMDVLELRHVRATGQPVLVAGAEDPLEAATDLVAPLGFLEAFPIQPKRVLVEPPPPRHLALLLRTTDRAHWRHAYSTAAWKDHRVAGPETIALGAIWTHSIPGSVELRRTPEGRLTTDLLPARPRTAYELTRSAPRWVAAPLAWGTRPHSWALRATASRARHAARGVLDRADLRRSETVLGHVRADPAPGYSALFSARHPVLPDQFVTRSTIEATDLGYRLEGVLGYVADVGADRHRGPDEILWGSRFGRARRYLE